MTPKIPVILVMLSLVGMILNAEPILNIDQPIRNLDVSSAEVKSAIVNAARAQSWSVTPKGEGRIRATYRQSNYMAEIAIRYAPTFYTITYADSKNLRYKGTNIHPTYNRLIKELQAAIVHNLKSGNYTPQPDAVVSEESEIRTKLEKVKRLYDDGLITKEEYDAKRKALIDAY